MNEQIEPTMAEQPTSDNPYVGPRPFTQEEYGRFFGRDREARELLSKVISERLLLFYAPSGAGKSSLLEARLIPALQEKPIGYTILPKGRVGGELPEDVADRKVANIYVYNLILSLLPDAQNAKRLTNVPLYRFLAGLRCVDGQPCKFDEAAARRAIKANYPKQDNQGRPRVLIIDQFEELVITHSNRWKDREEFFIQLDEAMSKDPLLWVLLTLREDYVASLDPYARSVANNLRKRNYMQRMDRNAALEAIKGPAKGAGRPFTDEAAGELARRLSLVRIQGQEHMQEGQYIEPILLQVVCYRLWENLKKRPGNNITIDDLHKFGDVETELAGFYTDEMQRVLNEQKAGITQKQLRDWFEKKLITEIHTRSSIPKGETNTAGMANEVVELLENYLLRVESRAGGSWIELIHDTFIEPILRSNQDWREKNRSPITLAAEAWQRDGKKPTNLLTGIALDEARTQLDRTPEEFSEIEKGFIHASVELDQQRRELSVMQRTVQLEAKKYLSEVGWGVIFPATRLDEDEKQKAFDAIKEALQPLLDHRRVETTKKNPEYYREFTKGVGYRPGETARRFLDRHGAGAGQVNPTNMPYYLLIVGDPEEIPFEFQYELSSQFAVGRIHFDEIEDYRSYAESVVQAETGADSRPRSAAFFAPMQPDNDSARIGFQMLIRPLLKRLEEEKPDWMLLRVLEENAYKVGLSRLLGGDETPAFLFVLSHCMIYSDSDDRQLAETGAVVCQDWPGVRQPLTREFYFAADDLHNDADMRGLVVFLFGSYTAGTPRMDDFWQSTYSERRAIAPRASLASLSRRLLAHPSGGALAVIGHVSKVWSYSYGQLPRRTKSGESEEEGTDIETFVVTMKRLMEGFPVGAAIEPFKTRHAAIASELVARLGKAEEGKLFDSAELVELWTKEIDARNWIIVGDPAVHLIASGLTPDMDILKLLYLREKGNKLVEEGNLEAAKAAYTQALALNPWLTFDPETEVQQRTARKLLREGEEFAKQGEVDKAVVRFKEAVKLDSTLQLDPQTEAERIAKS